VKVIKNTAELAMLDAYKPLKGSYPTSAEPKSYSPLMLVSEDVFNELRKTMTTTTPSPLSKVIAQENERLKSLSPFTMTMTTTPAHDHPLYPVLMAAIDQAMNGKGERHGGAVTPFMDQPWAHYAKMHGRGFLTGQAAKKLEEAATSKREGEAFKQEMLGAIVYAAMAILKEGVE